MSSSLISALYGLTVQQLKAHAGMLKIEPVPVEQAELVAVIERTFKSALPVIWRELTEIQQQAIAETLYAGDGVFRTNLFRAKYGCLPDGFTWIEKISHRICVFSFFPDLPDWRFRMMSGIYC